MTDNFNLKKFLTENRLTTNAKAQEVVNEGVETSWKDLWDALQAAIDKEDDTEAENALKVIAKAAASKVGAHAKSAVNKVGAYAKDKLQKYDDSLNEDEMGMDFSTGNTILAIINHLIDNNRQDVLDVLQEIPQWNELVDQATDM